jgi:hypothetical protein
MNVQLFLYIIFPLFSFYFHMLLLLLLLGTAATM